MARSIWKGVISFGMVSIPVKLYTATESKDVALNMLHEECKSRIKQKRWCPLHDREVGWDEIARGYEYAKDQYVVLTEEDLEKLPVPSKHTIQLSAFVDASEIDPSFHEKSYYLEPDEAGVKPYNLLMRALESKGLTAIANIAIRNKERLCALRPSDGTILLDTLLYADEIRSQDKPKVPEVVVTEPELQMAQTLIDMLSQDFKPEQYHDRYREAMLAAIESKLQGEEIVEAPAAPAPKVTDLMAALKASVEAARGTKPAAEEPEEEEAEAPRRRGRRRTAA
jgi:DNA end-binding protein Ku